MSSDAALSTPRPVLSGRIPSLDGLRALSIFLVVCLHTLQRIEVTHPLSFWWYGVFNGSSGVFIFFEISGFLITTLLLKEKQKNGSINLRGFYVRRGFRILPPLYLYIAVAALLGVVGRLALSWKSVLSAMFFYHNVYAPGGMWQIEHLWSISVEEQFYLVWPFLLVWCLARGGKGGAMKAAIFPLAVVLVSPVCRVLLGQSRSGMAHTLATEVFRFDFIMYGCAVALLQHTPRFEAVYRAATRIWWAPPAVMVMCNFFSARYQNYFDLTVGYTINGFAVAMFLLWCIRNADSVVGRVLNFAPIAWIGTLSYSIYLWQTLWLHTGNEAAFAPLGWLGELPVNWLGFLLCAVASFYLVEQPSLKLRDAIMRKLRGYRQGWAGASVTKV